MSSASAPRGTSRFKSKEPGRRHFQQSPRRAGRGSRSNLRQPWLLYALLSAAAIASVVLAVTSLGSPTASARTETETVTASDGVVQETASGSGNVAAGVDDEVNFQTSGILEHVYVKQGETVKKGQLLAELDPSTAELSLESAQATLAQAEETLSNDDSSYSSSESTADDTASENTTVLADATRQGATSVFADYSRTGLNTDTGTVENAPVAGTTTTTTTSTSASAPSTSSQPETGTTAPSSPAATVTVTVTTPSPTTSAGSASSGSGSSGSSSTGSSSTGSSSTGSSSSGSSSSSLKTSSSETSSSGSTGSTSSGSSGATVTAATLESDKVQVASDKAAVASAQNAVKETKLYAPVAGVIASLTSDSIGTEEGSSSSSSTGSSSSSSSSSTSAASGSSQTAGSLGGSSSTSASSNSSSGFAEIVNTKTLTLSVAFSESDINEIKVGQPVTVSISALSGVELAGKITAISPVGTTSSSVVSYDATVTIDQTKAKVKAGMTATASVIIDSQSGVTVPTAAVSGNTVQLIKNGKVTTQAVTVGLKGTSREIISSGLSAGDQLRVSESLPSLGASTSTTSSSSAAGGASGFGGASGSSGRSGFPGASSAGGFSPPGGGFGG